MRRGRSPTRSGWRAQEARIPFDLGAGPLLRATLLVLGEDEYVLLLTMHHIVSDGWSMGVFIRELSQLYGERAAIRPGSLPELPIQYSDYTLWQRENLTGEFVEEHLSYWREQLGGELPALQLPTDYPRPPAQSYLGARHRVVIPRALAEPLKALSRREGCDALYDAARGASDAPPTLHRAGAVGGRHLCGGAQPRRDRGADRLLPEHAGAARRPHGRRRFRELLGRVRELTLGAIEHQELPSSPIEMLMQELHLGRDRAREDSSFRCSLSSRPRRVRRSTCRALSAAAS